MFNFKITGLETCLEEMLYTIQYIILKAEKRIPLLLEDSSVLNFNISIWNTCIYTYSCIFVAGRGRDENSEYVVVAEAGKGAADKELSLKIKERMMKKAVQSIQVKQYTET